MELDLYDQYHFKALNRAMFAEKGRVNVTGNGFAVDNDLEFSVLIAGLYNSLGDQNYFYNLDEVQIIVRLLEKL